MYLLCIQEWHLAQSLGRMVGMDKLVEDFHEADFEGEKKIYWVARSVRNSRRESTESESLNYYVQLMENVVERGWGYVRQVPATRPAVHC